MSVSDPLLKKLKGYILQFHTAGQSVDDACPSLSAFCDTLEIILRKGLKQSNSIFGLTRRDYWNWVESLSCHSAKGRWLNPKVTMVVGKVQDCKKTVTVTGRGRLFLRYALQHKSLTATISLMFKAGSGVAQTWYDPELSIMGDEILSEIFMSLLCQVEEIQFKLDTENATFLDESWELPIYRRHEFVPCKDLGLHVQYVDGRPVVIGIRKGGVAEEDRRVEVGDMLDEVLGEPTREMKLGRMSKLLKQNQGYPVPIAVVKCHLADGSIYPPIAGLLHKVGQDVASLQRLLDEEAERRRQREEDATWRKPPHALLPEDDMDELPVHSNEGAVYRVRYCGKVEIGSQGGVDQIEGAVGTVLQRLDSDTPPQLVEAVIELGEKDIVVTSAAADASPVLTHSYTEVSSCGRRTDCVDYFAYIAGETTCTLAKKFVAFIFLARNSEESKTILCSIAQGFNRTHWFV